MVELKQLKQLKQKDVEPLRNQLLKEQNGKCALCNVEINSKTGVSLDHQHKLKSEKNGIDGNGLIRGVLCRACNVWEGKIWNSTKRYLGAKTVQEHTTSLKNLVAYYEKENLPFIHPSEQPKEPKLSKRNYNKLKKLWDLNKKRKLPPYPKSGKLTMPLLAAFEEFNIKPYN